MGKLVLVKHSMPVLDADVPSPRWVLSDDGRRRCSWVSGVLRAEGVQRLYSSLEPKALETAALVGMELTLPVAPRAGLQENDRTGLGFLPAGKMRRTLADFFARPADLVMGTETADAALARFEPAVRAVVAEADGTAAVVTHGTVLTLLVARHNAINSFDFWGRLTTPSCVVLDTDSFALLSTHLFPKA
jgi:broad specificity phosphatase PhoE